MNNNGSSDYSEINALLSRMGSLLQAGDFRQADECCNYVLHLLPGYGPAYLGKLLAEFGLKQPEDLLYTDAPFSTSRNYNSAVYNSDEETRRFLIAAPFENYYLRAKNRMTGAKSASDMEIAAAMFDKIAEYRDSAELAVQCRTGLENGRIEEQYQKASEMMLRASDVESLQSAADAFSLLNGYRDSSEKRKICLKRADNLRRDIIYESAADPVNCSDLRQLQDALEKYESIRGWKDAGEKAVLCRNRISDLEKARRTKRNRFYVIAAAALVCLMIAMGLIFWIFPLSNYNRANELLRRGAYAEAAEAFRGMNGFMDSENKALEAELAITEQQYQQASALMESENYTEAAEAFRALGSYRDSAAKADEAVRMIMDSQYRAASQYIAAGSYMEAIEILTGLEGYEDSDALLDQAYTGMAAVLSRSDTDTAVSSLNAMEPAVSEGIISHMDPDSSSRILIRVARVGDILQFGQYEQDNDPYNGKEPVEWIVLAREGNILTLISRDTLEVRAFHDEMTGMTWSGSSLRQWLNGDFYYESFTPGERQMIRLVPNDNTGGEITEDYVYLLSSDEAETLFASNDDRKAGATAYVLAKNAETENGFATWWLRTPGFDEYNTAYIYTDGSLHSNGIYVFSTQDAVRPVIQIMPEAGS